MLLTVGGPLASAHAALHPLLPSAGTLNPLRQHTGTSSITATGDCTRRQHTRPNSASVGPRLLHPRGSGPDGVPSSLFTFQPRTTPKKYPQDRKRAGGDFASTSSAPVAGEENVLRAGLMDESDLPDVSALLVEVFEPGVVLADGKFTGLESVILGAPIDMTNNYMKAVAYNEILYSLRSRCGNRLTRGDFDRSSDALVLAVRGPPSTSGKSSSTPATLDGDADGGVGGGGGAGEMVAVVELTIRKPDGSLPLNWPFPAPWRREKPPEQWQPYMCNLAVAEEYRGNGYGKQLVRLCEHVAKNSWGYERMYLHVDLGDPAATGLYSSMGYEGIEKYDAPLWMRKLLGWPTIRYQVKQFKGRKGAPALATAEAVGRDDQT
ncbi:unnamed protein product [Ectocarpus sp. 4 AP-2014]